MSTLHLSVINDGSTYERRLQIERSGYSEPTKNAMYRMVCAFQARQENRKMECNHNDADITECARLVGDYMRQHVEEF